MARVLAITHDVRERARHVKAHAEKHLKTLDEMREIVRLGLAIGDDDAYCLEIEHGYHVVYSQEEQQYIKDGVVQPAIVPCHHISVSVGDGKNGKYPHELAFAEICKLFDIDFEKRVFGWVEKECCAVHAIIPIQDP